MAAMYGPMIKAALNGIQTLLVNSTRDTLKDVPNENIMRGERTKDFVFPGIYIEPVVDDITDATVRRQESIFEVRIGVTVKDYEEPELLDAIIDLVGAIYDELMIHANRTIADNVTLDTISKTDWGYNEKAGQVVRWCAMTATVRFDDHVVS